MQNKKAIIIGGGLTGLTTAYRLKKSGWQVLVLEKGNEVGGAMKTIYEDGFVFETGANTGVLGNPETAELFEELSDLCTLEIANPKAKRRLILKNGKLRPLPYNLYTAVTTPLFTFGDKFRILFEPFRKKGTDEFETVGNIIRRRMGNSFADYAIDPFVSGIYAGDPDKLAIKYALPKMWALENKYGSICVGGMKRAREMKRDIRLRKATRDVISAKGGFGKLINALVQRVGKENIVCSAGNISVRPAGQEWEISYSINNSLVTQTVPTVISTIAATGLPQLLPFLPQTELGTVCNVEYAKVTEVSLGFKNWRGPSLQAFGCLIPSKENKKVLGILYLSSFLENRAPEKGALLSVYIGGIRHPEYIEWNDKQVTEIVEDEVRFILNYPEMPSPDIVKIFRHHSAIPQYTKATKERLQAIREVEDKYPGLIIAGNVRNGIGMADRIKQAYGIAGKLTQKQE